MTFGSLFSGIGGIDLRLERAGMTYKWQVEIDEFCQKVLSKHWPSVPKRRDVKEFPPDPVDDWKVDLIAGGFPCQPVSLAGSRKGKEDERWLWPEFARVLRVLGPKYALLENVPGLLSLGFSDVLRDLAEIGYDAEWEVLPASAFGAPHKRERIFVVAYSASNLRRTSRNEVQKTLDWSSEELESNSSLLDGERAIEKRNRARKSKKEIGNLDRSGRKVFGNSNSSSENALTEKSASRTTIGESSWWEVEPAVGRMADGVPGRVDRLRSLGNAVVPQVAEWLGKKIIELDAKAKI
jgi:DNA (cytosine-5)-methyltransferase 1